MTLSKFEIILFWPGGLWAVGCLLDYRPNLVSADIIADIVRPIFIIWTPLLLIGITYRFWLRSEKKDDHTSPLP